MPSQRLPIVNADDGSWGNILNNYLTYQHVQTQVGGVNTYGPGNGGHQNVTITAGTSSNAPLTFAAGTNLTTPVAGSFEFDGTFFYLTSSSVRKTIAIYNDSSGAAGDTYYRDSSGNFTRLGIGSAGQVLTVASGLPAWQASTGGGLGNSFETVSQNLSAYPKTLNYTSGTLSSITYTVGSNSITKTFNYTSGTLTSIVLSGSGLPSITTYTKTLSYTSGTLTSVSYS
jgi:hypothetical protein